MLSASHAAGLARVLVLSAACLQALPVAAQLLPGLELPGLQLPSGSTLLRPLEEEIVLPPGPLELVPGTERVDGTIRQGLQNRAYILIRPVGAPSGAPVALMLHPYGATNIAQSNLARASRLAADHGAWVYLPMGLYRRWSDTPARPGGPDDVAFLSALIQREVVAHSLDASRVYGFGFSNGGFMLQRLACEAPGLLAGMALVGASLRDAVKPTCAVRRLPVLFFNGSADPIVYPEGRPAYGYGSLDDLLLFWSARNECPGSTETTELPDAAPDDGTTVTLRRYTGCPDSEIRYYRINDGGHTWPGSLTPTPNYGLTSTDIDATIEGWQVLIGYSRPAP